MTYQPKFDALVDKYTKIDEFVGAALRAGQKALPGIKKALPGIKKSIQKHGPELAQGIQQILQTVQGGEEEEDLAQEEEPIPGVTKPGEEDDPEVNPLKNLFKKTKPGDQKQVNTDLTKQDPQTPQQVTTVPTRVKKIPMNVQRQMIDGAINGILNGGISPNILKKQVRQAISQIK